MELPEERGYLCSSCMKTSERLTGACPEAGLARQHFLREPLFDFKTSLLLILPQQRRFGLLPMCLLIPISHARSEFSF